MAKLQELINANGDGPLLVRRDIWRMPADYAQFYIRNGRVSFWGKLYSEMNEQINGRNPVHFPTGTDSADDWQLFSPATKETTHE